VECSVERTHSTSRATPRTRPACWRVGRDHERPESAGQRAAPRGRQALGRGYSRSRVRLSGAVLLAYLQ